MGEPACFPMEIKRALFCRRLIDNDSIQPIVGLFIWNDVIKVKEKRRHGVEAFRAHMIINACYIVELRRVVNFYVSRRHGLQCSCIFIKQVFFVLLSDGRDLFVQLLF
jgi:hypothetical protein